MGRKKSKRQRPEDRIFCWYCEKTFQDEHVLANHQKEKHLKCPFCHKRMQSLNGLLVHCASVHKETIMKVPNAIEGRDTFDFDVYGMDGIPDWYWGTLGAGSAAVGPAAAAAAVAAVPYSMPHPAPAANPYHYPAHHQPYPTGNPYAQYAAAPPQPRAQGNPYAAYGSYTPQAASQQVSASAYHRPPSTIAATGGAATVQARPQPAGSVAVSEAQPPPAGSPPPVTVRDAVVEVEAERAIASGKNAGESLQRGGTAQTSQPTAQPASVRVEVGGGVRAVVPTAAAGPRMVFTEVDVSPEEMRARLPRYAKHLR